MAQVDRAVMEQQLQPDTHSRQLPVALGIVLAVGGLVLHYVFSAPINHDAAWMLNISRELLYGAELYVDIIEINPPLIIWLGVPVILLERVTGVSYTTLFPVLVAIGAAISMVASYRLSRHVLSSGHRPAFLVTLAVVLFLLPAGVWGQREHLMMTFTLPYIIACAAYAKGVEPGRAWPIGIAAGLGFALKPHFVPVLIALVVWLYVTRRSVWGASKVAAGVILVYGVVAAGFTNYLLMWGLWDEYVAYSPPMPADWRIVLPLVMLAMVAIPGEGRELRNAIAISTAVWGLAVIVQDHGFPYHFIPALGGASVLLVLAVAAVSGRRIAIPLVVAGLLAGALGLALPAGDDPRWTMIREAQALTTPGEPAAMLNYRPSLTWPYMAYTGARWALPSQSLWPMFTTERGVELAIEWTIPVLRQGVDVLVPLDNNSALPRLMQNEDFRRAWEGYAETQRGEHYQLFTRPH